MADLRILTYGSPVLRKVALPVADIDGDLHRFVHSMADIMYRSQGIGLAAPQVGDSRQIVVMDAGKGLITLFNPQITNRHGRIVEEEGCLSLPEIIVPVKRAEAVRVKGLTPDGKEAVLEAEGLLARIIQHEIDHLQGALIIDHASLIKRLTLCGKLKKLRKSV